MGKLPILDDLFYRITPYYNLIKPTEALIALSAVIFFYYIYSKKDYNKLPDYIFMYGAFQIIRAFLVILSPFEAVTNGDGIVGDLFTRSGMFPSGHIAVPFFFYLFTYKKFKYYNIFLLLTILVGLGLIISRGHYSIDIFGSLFIIYTVVNFYEKLQKRKNLHFY